MSMGDLLGFSKVPYLKQLIQIYEKNKSPVISVEEAELEATSRFGVIDPKKSMGRLHIIKSIVEKPGPILAPSKLILTGKYILTHEIFKHLDKLVKNYTTSEVKLADALRDYAKTHDIYAYECMGKIQDTGNKLDFIKTSINFGLAHPHFGKDLKKFIKQLK
mgnify:CR=1 FL=1